MTETLAIDYPGALAPERRYDVDADGVRIAVHEWGNEQNPILMLAHGGGDFSRTFDVFAPLLASAGFRVVAWDHRGHGNSQHAQLYSWEADVRDAAAVFDHVAGRKAVCVIGHSKGGAMMLALADAEPFRFRCLVNMDGIPSKRPTPDVAEHERSNGLSGEISTWLDHRRLTATAERRPGTIEELAARRGRMNPRLDALWLRRLVTVGATEREDGWRWNLDPSIRFGGFGPWRPEWTLHKLAGLSMPFLGVLVEFEEMMGFRTQVRHVQPFLPVGGRLERLSGVGHFPHIETPQTVADLVLDFISGAV